MSVVLMASSVWRPSALRSTRNRMRRNRLRRSSSYISAMARRVLPVPVAIASRMFCWPAAIAALDRGDGLAADRAAGR